MQIPSTPSYQPPVRPAKASGPGEVARNKAGSPVDDASEADAVSSGDPFTASAYEPIQQAMNNLPDSRADVIAHGQALIANPTYPGIQIIGKLAAMFVSDAQASLVGDN